MNKLGLVFVLILVLNLNIFLGEAIPFPKPLIKKTESGGVVERADAPKKCRKVEESCDSERKCCPGFDCNVLIFSFAFGSSLRCGYARNKS
ncbi:hypothetical protein TNCV_1320091 [Trichonephila clavipes]|nr:hypothetical protein TNCV_1320091 [Trichonephila clavipes]